MTVSAATLNGHRVTSARATIPPWGCWFAEASIDGEVALSGPVELKIADLTLKGTVLSGGPMKGRSTYRIVAGAGGWGRTIPEKAYANDGSDKVSTVLGDAARAVGETLADIANTERVGPGFTREEGPASRVLQLVAEGAWYVDEAGVTRLGARAPGALVGSVTRVTPVDFARGKVVIAAESIATILPGVVVDGLTAVDVQHDISADGGLRSTLWGSQASSALDSLAALIKQLDPDRAYRGVTEYRIVTLSGNRLNLQPTRVSSGMPELSRVPVRPGVAGCTSTPALGARVLVGFVDSDRARPFVVAFEDADGSGFQPTAINLMAGGMSGGEHVMTTEATVLLVYNVLVALMTAAGGGPLLAAVLQPLIVPAIIAACSAQGAPAPPGLIAQTALNVTLGGSMAAGTTPSPALGPLAAGVAILATKTANDSGFFPSIGSKAVEAG